MPKFKYLDAGALKIWFMYVGTYTCSYQRAKGFVNITVYNHRTQEMVWELYTPIMRLMDKITNAALWLTSKLK